MVAVLVASVFGYMWLDAYGAVLFLVLGLWSHWGPGRRWALGSAQLGLLIGVAAVLPSVLWMIGYARPNFAISMFELLSPASNRVLDLTAADGNAWQRLSETGKLHQFPAVRLGIAAAWLCALPVAACIVLWWRGLPVIKTWARDGQYYDPMPAMFLSVPVSVVLTAMLVGGFGFSGERRNLSDGLGVLMQPCFFAFWLINLKAWRTLANWWCAPTSPDTPPTP